MSVQSKSGFDVGPLPSAQRERLARGLSQEERRVLLDHGTEPPFCGGLLSNKEAGVYACRLCALPLFRSVTKFARPWKTPPPHRGSLRRRVRH